MGKINFNNLRTYILAAGNSYIAIFLMILIFEGKPDYIKPLYLGLGIALGLTIYLSKKKMHD